MRRGIRIFVISSLIVQNPLPSRHNLQDLQGFILIRHKLNTSTRTPNSSNRFVISLTKNSVFPPSRGLPQTHTTKNFIFFPHGYAIKIIWIRFVKNFYYRFGVIFYGEERAVIEYYWASGRNSEARSMRRYIEWETLKLLAMILHAIYRRAYPKYSKHSQRKILIMVMTNPLLSVLNFSGIISYEYLIYTFDLYSLWVCFGEINEWGRTIWC